MLAVVTFVSFVVVAHKVFDRDKPVELWFIPALFVITTIGLFITWSQKELTKQVKLEPVIVTDFGDKFVVSYSGHAVLETKDPSDLQLVRKQKFVWEQHWTSKFAELDPTFSLEQAK